MFEGDQLVEAKAKNITMLAHKFDRFKRERDQQEDFQAQLHRILMYALLRRLDSETKQYWNMSLRDLPSYDNLRKFLGFFPLQQIEAFELNSATNGAKRQSKKTKRRGDISVHATSATKDKCVICKGAHALAACKKFLELSIWSSRTSPKGSVLFLCLGPNHRMRDCQTNTYCKHCQGDHSVLHGVTKGRRVSRLARTVQRKQVTLTCNLAAPGMTSIKVISQTGKLSRSARYWTRHLLHLLLQSRAAARVKETEGPRERLTSAPRAYYQSTDPWTFGYRQSVDP